MTILKPANYELKQCRNIRGITEGCQFCEFISRCRKGEKK